MRTITSDAELTALKDDRSLVSIYVDHGYDPEGINAILGMKDAFDAHVHDAWHMLIPCKVDRGADARAGRQGYGVDAWIGSEQFGHELNRALIERYRVVEDDLPALVFEFDAENEYFHIPLGDRPHNERAVIIRTIAGLAKEAVMNGPRDVKLFRDALHERVALYGFQVKALRIMSKASSRLAALVGLGSDLKGLIEVR